MDNPFQLISFIIVLLHKSKVRNMLKANKYNKITSHKHETFTIFFKIKHGLLFTNWNASKDTYYLIL